MIRGTEETNGQGNRRHAMVRLAHLCTRLFANPHSALVYTSYKVNATFVHEPMQSTSTLQLAHYGGMRLFSCALNFG